MVVSAMNIMEQIAETVVKIRPLLAGLPATVQGGVLADLLAIWLAGHYVLDDKETTAELREDLIEAHTRAVRALIPVNEDILGIERRARDGDVKR